MTVTAQKSTQLANLDDLPIANNLVVDDGKVRLAYFDFTQDGAGDANSTVDLVKFGPGRFRIIPALSWVKFSALTTDAVLDVGYLAYTKLDGSSGAAASDAIEDGLDVDAAGVAFLGVGTNAAANAGGILIESKDGLTIQAKALTAGIPDNTTLRGWIAYVRD
jgi:hypothetical protein